MAITDGRVSGFAKDDQGLGIAVSHAPYFKEMAINVLFMDHLFYRLKQL
jgi:hypothetical protein